MKFNLNQIKSEYSLPEGYCWDQQENQQEIGIRDNKTVWWYAWYAPAVNQLQVTTQSWQGNPNHIPIDPDTTHEEIIALLYNLFTFMEK